MASLIKVERVIEKDGDQTNATRIKLLTTIFPDYAEGGYKSQYNGVCFSNLTDSSWIRPSLLGIQLEAGTYGNMLRRRIMIKDGCLDADALRQKYEELKLHASDVKEREKASAKYRAEVEAAYNSVIKDLGLTETGWRSDIRADTKTTVRIEGKTDWQGLKLIQETLRETITVALKLSVPVEHAKIVYETLNRGE